MKLIKQATTYKCVLPAAHELEKHLAKFAFFEPGPHDYSSNGFVPVMDDRFVLPFPGGYAIKLKMAEKILPKAALRQEADKRLQALLDTTGGNATRELHNKFVDEVFNELIATALVQTHAVTAYYHIDDELLVVNSASKRFAGALTAWLVKAVGSVKATTIYIDGITQSLTSKLLSELEGGPGFAGFDVGGVCKLTGEEGTSASVKLHTVKDAKIGIIERIEAGQQVVELELNNDDVSFRLDKRFITKGIFFKHGIAEDGFEPADAIEEFQHEASCQMLWLSQAFRDLLTLFEYKSPTVDASGGAA